jgi:hypothetical protein
MMMPGQGADADAIWLASNGWKFNTIKEMWMNPLDSEYHTVQDACDILTMNEREEEKYKPITCPDCEPVHILRPHIGDNGFGATVCGCHCHLEQIAKWS